MVPRQRLIEQHAAMAPPMPLKQHQRGTDAQTYAPDLNRLHSHVPWASAMHVQRPAMPAAARSVLTARGRQLHRPAASSLRSTAPRTAGGPAADAAAPHEQHEHGWPLEAGAGRIMRPGHADRRRGGWRRGAPPRLPGRTCEVAMTQA